MAGRDATRSRVSGCPSRPHSGGDESIGRAALAAAGATRLLRRQRCMVRRVGPSARHCQRLRTECRRRTARSECGHGNGPWSARFVGDAPGRRPCREQSPGADVRTHGSRIPAEVIVSTMIHAPTRRELLLGSGALFAWTFVPRVARAEGRDPRFLTIVLRGALDGLAAVAPVGDPDWVRLRGDKALLVDGANPALKLDGFFALNSAMPELHRLYQAEQATIVHAASTPYRERSHFDGQDVLESGLTKPGATDTGWLNRALAALEPGGRAGPNKRLAFAVGPVTPLVVRG